MPRGPKRTAVQRERQRLECLDLYLAGWWQTEIAKKLRISQSQVSRDIKTAHDDWCKRTTYNLDEHKAKRLAELDALERQAQNCLRRSIGVHKVTTKKTGGELETDELTVKSERLAGDAAFLNAILNIISERCRILGTYAATKQITATVAPKLLAAAQIDSL